MGLFIDNFRFVKASRHSTFQTSTVLIATGNYLLKVFPHRSFLFQLFKCADHNLIFISTRSKMEQMKDHI